MNRQTFSEYLEQPSKLYQLSLTELQGLVLEYPYSANLRQLLLLKAKLENHPRAEEMLQQAASRTFDRGFLFDLVERLNREGLAGVSAGDRLELRELDQLDFELLPADNEADRAAMAATPGPDNPLVNAVVEQLESDDDELDWLSEAQAGLRDEAPEDEDGVLEVGEMVELTVSTERPGLPPGWVDSAAAVQAIVSGFFRTSPPPPQPVTDFTRQERAQPSRLAERLKSHRRRQLAQLDGTTSPPTIKEIAKQSVSEHEEVASETLAALLVRQQQYEKAIKMYRRLSLLYPEKKPIFAGLIIELKEKL